MKNVSIIIIVIVIIGAITGIIAYSSKNTSNSATANTSTATQSSQSAEVPDPNILNRANAPHIGDAKAKVQLVLFSDFLCPYCKTLHGTLGQILADNPTQVSLEQRTFLIHDQAKILHQAAEAAVLQGKFKEMSDAIFAGKADTTQDSVVKLAGTLGLDVQKFTSDLNSSAVNSAIDKDNQDAQTLGLQGTPSLFIDGKFVEDPSQVTTLISQALKN